MIIPETLNELARLAQQQGTAVYLVGGAVRDLLLGAASIDYDLLCEGDAITLANWLEEQGLARILQTFGQFGTAKITYAQTPIDLASARQESYACTGALPQVHYPVTASEDLARRDFTINAIAMPLPQSHNEPLLDPFAGQQDLQAGVIRVLHARSYYEDPTRILRAVRFAVRFGYQICPEDKKLIAEALNDTEVQGIIFRRRGGRMGIELRRIFELPNYTQACALMHELEINQLFGENIEIRADTDPNLSEITDRLAAAFRGQELDIMWQKLQIKIP